MEGEADEEEPVDENEAVDETEVIEKSEIETADDVWENEFWTDEDDGV